MIAPWPLVVTSLWNLCSGFLKTITRTTKGFAFWLWFCDLSGLFEVPVCFEPHILSVHIQKLVSSRLHGQSQDE